jgi:hypothetical protein
VARLQHHPVDQSSGLQLARFGRRTGCHHFDYHGQTSIHPLISLSSVWNNFSISGDEAKIKPPN